MVRPSESETAEGIEGESLRRVERILQGLEVSPGELEIAKRVVHATGDPEMGRCLVFSLGAVKAGVRAIRAGEAMVVDVKMVEVGIDAARAQAFGVRVRCEIGDPKVREEAKRLGITRARVAIRRGAGGMRGGIVAIGNAPTALLEILSLIEAKEASPALVIGVPVGWVGATESKELLITSSVPHIALPGTRGGSAVAVSIVNALLRLASGGA